VDIALWVAQVLAALIFGYHGSTLLFRMQAARAQFRWANDVSDPLLRLIGGAEIAGAVGVILPALTRVLPWLTPLAAVGLFAVVVLAAVFHITRPGWPGVVFNMVLAGLTAFVAHGRFVVVPFA
jgi:putative oxidoreductase